MEEETTKKDRSVGVCIGWCMQGTFGMRRLVHCVFHFVRIVSKDNLHNTWDVYFKQESPLHWTALVRNRTKYRWHSRQAFRLINIK